MIDDEIYRAAVTKLTSQKTEENSQKINLVSVFQTLIKKFVSDYA